MIEFHKSSIFSLQFSMPFFCGIILFFILMTAPARLSAQTFHAVRWVIDGDTIVLSTGRRIRYIGINAPEIDHEQQKAEPHGFRARNFNEKMVGFKSVRLEIDLERYDRFGRDLAYIYLADGTFVNAELVKSGLAFYLYRPPNLKHDNTLLKAQLYAMQLKRGIWHNWRPDRMRYIGNRDSRRFHVRTCRFAKRIKNENRIHFSGKWNAFARGYAPDKQCIPEFWSYGAGE